MLLHFVPFVKCLPITIANIIMGIHPLRTHGCAVCVSVAHIFWSKYLSSVKCISYYSLSILIKQKHTIRFFFLRIILPQWIGWRRWRGRQIARWVIGRREIQWPWRQTALTTRWCCQRGVRSSGGCARWERKVRCEIMQHDDLSGGLESNSWTKKMKQKPNAPHISTA